MAIDNIWKECIALMLLMIFIAACVVISVSTWGGLGYSLYDWLLCVLTEIDRRI